MEGGDSGNNAASPPFPYLLSRCGGFVVIFLGGHEKFHVGYCAFMR